MVLWATNRRIGGIIQQLLPRQSTFYAFNLPYASLLPFEKFTVHHAKMLSEFVREISVALQFVPTYAPGSAP